MIFPYIEFFLYHHYPCLFPLLLSSDWSSSKTLPVPKGCFTGHFLAIFLDEDSWSLGFIPQIQNFLSAFQRTFLSRKTGKWGELPKSLFWLRLFLPIFSPVWPPTFRELPISGGDTPPQCWSSVRNFAKLVPKPLVAKLSPNANFGSQTSCRSFICLHFKDVLITRRSWGSNPTPATKVKPSDSYDSLGFFLLFGGSGLRRSIPF